MASKMLIVESDKNVLSCSKMVFQHYGFDVDTAETLLQAIDRISRSQYDVIITELCLENKDETDGLKVIEYIKANSIGTKIIVATHLCNNSVRDNIYQHGIHAYFEKPVSLDRIIGVINNS